MKYKLSNICSYRSEKINVDNINEHTYISTENMLPNKAGITISSGLPNVNKVCRFYRGDILVSNIRPYFKKIWKATFDGGCSNDVLVLSANDEVNPDYLYYILSNDAFFDHSTATAKGTKMPRGDKKAIMEYMVPDFSFEEQEQIAKILAPLDEKIALNNKINDNLAA